MDKDERARLRQYIVVQPPISKYVVLEYHGYIKSECPEPLTIGALAEIIDPNNFGYRGQIYAPNVLGDREFTLIVYID